MTVSKIRIKLGAIEVEYEGSESFLKEELPDLLNAVSELHKRSKIHEATSQESSVDGSDSGSKRKGSLEATTASIAAKLSVKSGPDLIIAAAARLTFVLGHDKFSRQQIIDEMKSASAYHKSNYINNLSTSLTRRVKDGRLNEPTQGKFALTATESASLESRIA